MGCDESKDSFERTLYDEDKILFIKSMQKLQ